MEELDIFIIGSGIHGTAIAADAAGRGLHVLLCEKEDLASATSSASTKLIHGGLRYLEQYDFKLVRSALREREILMRKAPHLIAPLEFILPHDKHLRPAWMIRLGLFLYDHLARRHVLPHSKYLRLNENSRGTPLQSKFNRGFSYYDCFTDDARLTLLNALAAKEKGATILTRHKFISAQREKNSWKIKIKDSYGKKIFYVRAKAIVNASGPWVDHLQQNIDASKKIRTKLVKGSHIVVPKLYDGEFAYILQNSDDRIIFAIPYQQQFTLIGTTDVSFSNNFDNVHIKRGEEQYLCSVINFYFNKQIMTKDIVWSYAGVRCLQSDNAERLSKTSRDHKIIFDPAHGLPLLTIVGGKLTTHRIVAEEVLTLLKSYFSSMQSAWTETAPLPGGDFPNHDFAAFFNKLKQEYSWVPQNIILHYVKNYGTRAYLLLGDAKQMSDLGEPFSDVLYQKEIEYLIKHEWAKTVNDIVWRRTKFGLTLTPSAQKKLSRFLHSYIKP